MVYRFLFVSFTLIRNIFTRTVVTGRENVPPGACIVVANHVNLLDSPLLGISLGRRVYFMAKKELFENRMVGFFTRRFGGFPVEKGVLDRRGGKTALDHLARGRVLVIFPEGKRSPDGKMGPAYNGAALLACHTGAPVVPVGITGTARLSGKAWPFHRPQIALNIGPSFRLTCSSGTLSKEMTSRFAEEIMNHIAARLPEEYRGRYKPV